MRKIYYKTLFCFFLYYLGNIANSISQTPVPMATQPGLSYTENFADIAAWSNAFASGIGANRFGSVAVNATGTIPDGVRITTSTATFVIGTSGGVQKGTAQTTSTQSIVLLSTGATDNTSSDAIDFFMDFTGVNAGTLSYNWGVVFNSTGNRNGSLRVYASTNGTTFTEITGAQVLNFTNNIAGSGSITTVSLPTSFNNSPTARLRFYYHNGTGGTTGSRPKISIDDLTVTAVSSGASVTSIAAGSNATEGGSDGNFTINFSPATSAVTTLDYVLTASGYATFTTDYGASLISFPTAGVSPAFLSATSATVTVPAGVSSVTVTIASVDDALAEGTESVQMIISNPSSPYTIGTASATIFIIDNEPTAIHTIQGSGTSAIAGMYTTSGIVTGVYPTLSPAGFYIEEPNATWDADPNTSEGIFVVSTASVAVGDNVTVSGTVQENAASPSFNQAVFATVTSVSVISTGNPLPTTVDVMLPVTALTDYEKYEGMRVRFPGTMTVTDNSTLGNFGELKLSSGGLVYQPTQIVDPNDDPASGTSSSGTSNVVAVTTYNLANTLRTILLDDGRSGTLPSLPYVNADNTVRVGSTIDNMTGILGYAFNQYRIQPAPLGSIVFTHAVRPAVPDYPLSVNLKVASFNVLNYFDGTPNPTLPQPIVSGFPTPRGAHSAAEFTRQRDKIISALTEINADVVGLIEIANNGTANPSAIQNLVDGLNSVVGAGTYAYINDGATTQTNNTDQIRCAIIFKPSKVTPVGPAMLSSDPVFNRPPLAQTFNLTATNKNFNFIVNHFKSKGGTGTGLDADLGDGQAAFNNTRRLQSNALISFITGTVIPASSTDRIITVGDYNAYYEEDPMDILRAGGYTVLGSATSYSYLFAGQLGSLDHAVISPSLAGSVNRIAKWNTNSVEPSYLDYNDAVADGGGDVVNPWASTYTPSPWRASDHDAIILDLFLDVVLPVTVINFSATKENTISKISWTTSQEINSKEFIVERSVNGGATWQTVGTVPAGGTSVTTRNYILFDNNPVKGINLYRLKSVDMDNKFSYSATRRVNFESKYAFSIYPNPATEVLQLTVDNAAGFNARVQVINTKGQVLINKQINSSVQPAPLNVSSLAPGIYFIKIITADAVVNMEKFTKQ